jgi:type I restriction enzyme S subunit
VTGRVSLLPFDAVFDDISAKGKRVPQGLYLREGHYPIVDQGKASIAGFTSDSSYLFQGETPVIVFGDHTRCVKFVDFPFCIGADGVKILCPKIQADTKFLYHYLGSVSITDAGYSRHYKFLKRIEIPLPPFAEQKRIAAILDQADALRRKRREALARLDTLLQSVFLEMFVHRSTSNWPLVTVEDVAQSGRNSIRTGPFGSQLLHSEFVDDGVAVLGIDNAVQNTFTWAGRRFITEAKYAQLKRYTVFPGDVIITIMGTCGRCAVVPNCIPKAINTKHLCCITLDQESCLPIFLHSCFLQHPAVRRQLSDATRGAIMDGLNMGIIKDLSFPLPPLERQRQFACWAKRLEDHKMRTGVALERMDDLFACLQERSFRGDLFTAGFQSTSQLCLTLPF